MSVKGYLKKKKSVNKMVSIYRANRKKHEEKKRLRKSSIIEMRVDDLFFQQNTNLGFNRLDIIVRLIAIECTYGLNSYGWDLYKKMQDARCTGGLISTEERVEIFEELIKSWELNGYDDKSLIEIDRNHKLIDGSHRIALALFYNLDVVKCRVYSDLTEVKYGEEWFELNGFTQKEIDIINTRFKEIIQETIKQEQE